MSQGLKRELKSRHLAMISIGAIIGTGLFLNSGYTISSAGPGGSLLCYIAGGFLMWLVMVCLAELAVAMPESGSFHEYSSRLASPAVGNAIGWLYWFSWVLTIAWYLSAVGIYMQYWWKGSPLWLWYLVFGAVLFIFNCLSVKVFGEGQFWFAGLKVFAVLIFILIGLAAVFGGFGEKVPGLQNLMAVKGFFPVAFIAVLPVMMNVSFSYQGCEVLGNTAGESQNPAKEIPRAIRSTVLQVTGVYVVSVLVLMTCLPWTSFGMDESPFVTVLSRLGIPGVDHIMNIIVITAALSAANSAVYTCTRFTYSLALKGAAPKSMMLLNKRKIPFNALLLTSAGIAICILSGEIPLLANTVNVWMWAVSGIIGAIAWIMIGICLILFRRHLAREGKSVSDLAYRSPGYPLVPILVIVLNIAILFSMLASPDQRLSLYVGVPVVVVTFLFFFFRENTKQVNEKKML
ncbi:MAG: amino acid permease [Desulfobacterales bacterium]|nr:amino acid permease [Desulfobacterales bacterium]